MRARGNSGQRDGRMTARTPVFVYGTLRPGQPGFDELKLANRVEHLGPAAVAGSLYDLGDYPGAVLRSAGVIVGELLRPLDDAVLPLLDEFELFDPSDPAGSEYLRVPVTALGQSGSAWIYIYNFPLDGARLIASGDWSARAENTLLDPPFA